MKYEKKDFSRLMGMAGFSDKALDIHFALYEGYVKNTNKNMELLRTLDKESSEYAEVKRRLGWELNGAVLHELYFENLGGDGRFDKGGMVCRAMDRIFGSFEEWKEDFVATGKMRGIGWVVTYQDTQTGNLINSWINEHDAGHPAGFNPLLVMDVFEHAFVSDYGKDKGSYIDAFMKNIDWGAVEKRLK